MSSSIFTAPHETDHRQTMSEQLSAQLSLAPAILSNSDLVKYGSISDFQFGTLIGSGACSKVLTIKERQQRLRENGRQQTMACKMMKLKTRGEGLVSDETKSDQAGSTDKTCALPSSNDFRKLTDSIEHQTSLEELSKEVAMLQSLDHPGIIRFVDWYVENDRAYVITELCRGGSLEELLASSMGGRLTEETARQIMFGVLDALSFMHSRSVAHRDIKLANILFRNSFIPQDENDTLEFMASSNVVLADLGMAKRFNESANGDLHTMCGTPLFVAPEVLTPMQAIRKQDGRLRYSSSYCPKCDLWSVGVVLYIMLSGERPFDGGESIHQLIKNIQSGHVRFEGPIWEEISSDAVDLIRSLLKLSPEHRLDAASALRHRWFQRQPESSSNI